MKITQLKYNITWFILILLIAAATLGFVITLRGVEPGNGGLILPSLLWLIIVGAGITLFLYASREILKREMEKEEAAALSASEGQKKKKSRPKSEVDDLDIDTVARKITRRIDISQPPGKWGSALLGLLSSEIEIMSGVVYSRNDKGLFESAATYAFTHARQPYVFSDGEGLTGQATKNKQMIIYKTIPEEYSEVFSGLGSIKPSYLAMVPLVADGLCTAIIECAGFKYSVGEIDQLFQIVSRELSAKIQGEKKSDEQ